MDTKPIPDVSGTWDDKQHNRWLVDTNSHIAWKTHTYDSQTNTLHELPVANEWPWDTLQTHGPFTLVQVLPFYH